MFELIRNNKRFIQIVMVIIVLPFAFFGVESYFTGSSVGNAVANVEGQSISQQQFAQALDLQQQRVRELLGGRADPALLDSPDIRAAVLNNLIRDRLLVSHASQSGMTVTDSELQAAISASPAFQQDGKFSLAQYERFLRRQNLPAQNFEASVRQDLLQERLTNAYAATAFVPAAVVERVARLSEQQREVSSVVIASDQFLTEVKLEPDAAKTYYDSRQGEFQIPEQARVEYVALSLDSFLDKVEVSDDEAQALYRERTGQYEKPEERQASHILISSASDADEKTKAAAKIKAEQLAEQARKTPEKFAELAKTNSQDPGSADKGGDLGPFGRGAMVKPFEDAVYGMKVGEIAGPVESQFGYHIIKLTAIKPGATTSFAEVKDKLVAELKKQKAAKKFAEAVDNFTDLVYTQSDTLQSAAEAFSLKVESSGWLSRRGAEIPVLNNDKFLQAVFSEEVLINKRNTEAVETAPSTLVAARVLEHKPAGMRTFDEVKSDISARLLLEQATKLARQGAEAKLASLNKGEDAKLAWSAPQTVSRSKPEKYGEAALRQIFKSDGGKLPAYGLTENEKGLPMLFRISKVTEGELTADKRKALEQQLEQVAGQEALNAYLASLRTQADVEINKEAFERRDR